MLDVNTAAINRHLDSAERPECCECGTARDLQWDGYLFLCGTCLERDEDIGVDVSQYRPLDWLEE